MWFGMALNVNSVAIPDVFFELARDWGGFRRFGVSRGFCTNSRGRVWSFSRKESRGTFDGGTLKRFLCTFCMTV